MLHHFVVFCSIELHKGRVFPASDSYHFHSCSRSTPAQFPKGFKKAELPSGKGYLRLTPEPPQTA